MTRTSLPRRPNLVSLLLLPWLKALNWGLQQKKGEKPVFSGCSAKTWSKDGSVTQKRSPASSPDTVGVNKKTSTPSTSDRITKTKTTNLNLTLKWKQSMFWEPWRVILIRSGMHLCSRKMVQYNGFPNRLLALVRIFTDRLMMTRWRRLCIKFVGTDKIERVIHGNRSYIYGDMLSW